MIGETICFSDQKGIRLIWDDVIYELEDEVKIGKEEIYQDYIIHDNNDLEMLAYPLTEQKFYCPNAKRVNVIFILIDQNNDLYVRFGDAIGDIAIFPLIKSN